VRSPYKEDDVKVISWNLLRLTGAAVADVANLIKTQKPDLMLMQEATEELDALPRIVGGHFHREPLPGRIHGLAAWSPHPLPPHVVLPLPVSKMPGALAPRVAQLLRVGDVTFANVHLSHGQLLNRLQLLRVAQAVAGKAAVIGDYNAVGPTLLPGFRDVGPRTPTHEIVLPFRLDRCLVRGLHCNETRTLARGPSDHRPIVMHFAA
jgi:endonuclease/exonuclease/phosphatase (EEP) superfamily protein YafD